MLTWTAHEHDVRGIAFSPDGARLVTHAGGDPFARVWDTGTRAEVAAFRTPGVPSSTFRPSPAAVAFSRCGRYLAVGGAMFDGTGSRVLVHELATGQPLAARFPCRTGVMDAAFTPGDPPGLVVADGNRLLHFGNILTAMPAPDPVRHGRGPDRKTPKCSRLVYSADGTLLATNGKPKAVVWDGATLKPRFVRDHPKGPQNGPAAFDPAGTVLAVAHGTKVDLWRFAEPGAAAVELAGHKLPVWAVGFLPGGRTVQTASSDGTVRTWDAATGKEQTRYDFGIGKLYCAAFAPDGLTCAAGGANGQVVVWDVDT